MLESPKPNIGLKGRDYWLFLAGLALYLVTRFAALDKFPVFFFSDEAIQTMSAVDLISRGMRDAAGRLFPVYFENGGQYNLSLSVYLQVLPALLPRSIWLTRGISALMSLVVPISVSLALKQFFQSRSWWLAPVIISALPTWFLHSRTAFESSLSTAMFSLFLYFYLSYRLTNRMHLFPALLFGALSFYAYSPMQIVIGVTGVILLISDWQFHLGDKKSLVRGFGFLILLVLPYALFHATHQQALMHHLRQLQSYWVGNESLPVKVGTFLRYYVSAYDPVYWFLPNSVDLIRHQMKGLGHLPLLFMPFLWIGFSKAITKLRQPAWQVVIVTLATVPVGAALVGITITRLLALIVPMSVLICFGLDLTLQGLFRASSPQRGARLATWMFSAIFSIWMTITAVLNGPTWYENYGLYGLQWGGQTLFSEISSFIKAHPDLKVSLSPSWANGTDVIARYFLGDPLPIGMGTIEPYTLYQLALSKDQVFIMTPEEYAWCLETGKFRDVEVLETVPFPNGKPGFYFVSLAYVENISEIMEAEQAERRTPKSASIHVLDQDVQVEFSPLDINDIFQAFDKDDQTLIRTFEANPLVITIRFSSPVELTGVTALIGNAPSRLEVETFPADGSDGERTSSEIGFSNEVHPLSVPLDASIPLRSIRVSVRNLNETEPAHVHLWELQLDRLP